MEQISPVKSASHHLAVAWLLRQGVQEVDWRRTLRLRWAPTGATTGLNCYR